MIGVPVSGSAYQEHVDESLSKATVDVGYSNLEYLA
jgi:hypothetical protein